MLILATLSDLLQGGGSAFGVIVAFFVAAAIVVGAGTKLSAYGDALGERTGLGSGLVGLLFLAAVTSLPELVVSTTSTIAASVKASALLSQAERALAFGAGADLAIGNMVGSNVFNLMLFVLVDLVQGKGALLHRLSRNHVMSAASGLWMIGLLLFGFALCGRGWGGTAWIVPWLEVGPVTPILFLGYVTVMVLQGRLESRPDPDLHPEERTAQTANRLVTMPAIRFYGTLAVLALLIILGGIWLSLLGDRMAVVFGLKQSFIGTIFLALSTSLPELVVSISAARMGAFNMAAGNVLGSNIFNIVIVFTADIGLRGASILHYADSSHMVTMAMVMMLTCTLIIGMMYRSERHAARLGFDCWLMLVIYLFGNVLLYVSSTGAPEAALTGPALPPPTSAMSSAANARNTTVDPVMATALYPERNTIWCGTFQLAWNQLQNDVVGAPVQMQDGPDWLRALNAQPFTTQDLSPGSYLARSGRIEDGVVESIRSAMARQFPHATIGIPDAPTQRGFVCFAYLAKALPFATSFRRFARPMAFRGGARSTSVVQFGVDDSDHYGPAADRLRRQVSVLDYRSDDDFVLRLNTRTEKEELIVAKVTPGKTLGETAQSVLTRATTPLTGEDGSGQLEDGEVFAMPIVEIHLTKRFDELVGKEFTSPGPEGRQLTMARQDIRLRLDESGAKLESSATAMGVDSIINTNPRAFRLDKPFLLLLKERGDKAPYFAAWIADPEVLVKATAQP